MTVLANTVQLVLVPQGAEYQTVSRVLKGLPMAPLVISVPAGPAALGAFLAAWPERSRWASATLLLMGLGGSLSPDLTVGTGLLLEKVWHHSAKPNPAIYHCDQYLVTALSQHLAAAQARPYQLVDAVTCNRIITTVKEKRMLGDRYSAAVVDMESSVLLRALPQAQIAVLRVISDDCHHDLPDISKAIGPDGKLRSLRLARHFIRRPIAAARFIRGSLKGLKALEKTAIALFS